MKKLPLFHGGFSSSKAPLLEKCSRFADPDAEWSNDEAGPDAKFGLAVHRVAEHVIAEGRSDVSVIADEFVLADAQAARLFLVEPVIADFVKANRVEGHSWRVEVPFAWNPWTGEARELPKGEHRSYEGRGIDDVCTTLDVLVLTMSNRIVVVDFKSGFAHVAHPKENRQLLTQACAAAEVHGASEVLLVVAKISEDGFRLFEHLLDTIDLEEHRAWMADKLGAARGALPVPGPHCTELYCPAKASCPAVLESMHAALEIDAPTTLATEPFRFGPPTSPEHARWLVSALAVLETGIGVLRERLNAYAEEHGGIPCGDGKTYKPVVSQKTSLDLSKAGAIELLSSFGCSGVVNRSPSVTWDGIRKAIGKTKTEELRAAMAGIGAVKTSTSKSFKVVGP